jgi:cholinesterase
MGSNSFEPTADGTTGFPDYPNLGQSGKLAQLPVLTGNTDFETGVFIALDGLDDVTHDATYRDKFTNTMFSCPAGAHANVSHLHDLQIWRYRWVGNFPKTRLYTNPHSGAYHGSEMPFIYDTLLMGEDIPAGIAPERAKRSYIQGAWAAFAKDPTHGLSKYEGGWPAYLKRCSSV